MKKPTITAMRAGLLLAGACLAANTLAASTPLLDFSFNEGSGTNVTDSASKLVGMLGIYADPANAPVVVSDTPSGAASDKAVSLNVGNATSAGFLVVDDTNKVLASLATNAFTIESWVKIDPTDTRAFEGIGGYGNAFKLGLASGQIEFTLFGIVDIVSGLYLTPDGAWHHVAAVWQPGVGVTFYLDGASETPVAETRAIRAFSNNYLVIGAENIGGNAIQATIDRFRVHQAALTADQLDSVGTIPKAVLGTTLAAFNFTESAPPFASAATSPLKAGPSNDYTLIPSRPVFTTNAPSGKAGDYAISMAVGNKFTIDDPETKLALDQNDASFTIQAWLKFGAQPADNTKSVVFFNNGPGGALSFAVAADRHVIMTTLGVLDVNSAAVVPNDSGWHHVAVVHENGKEMRFYIDGVLSDTVAYTGGVIFSRTDTTFMFGSEGGGNPYIGSIDRFKLSQGTLTATELDSWPIPGVKPGLTIESTVRVSWPAAPGGYSLQSSTDLGDSKTWTTVTNTPFGGSDGYFLIFPSSANKVFYRLYKP